MTVDISTIGLGMETSGLVKAQAELGKTEQAANKTADAADRVGAAGKNGMGELEKATQTAERQMSSARSTAETFARSLGTGFTVVAVGATAMAAAIAAMAKSLYDASVAAERLRLGLDFASGGNGAKELAYVTALADKLGLSLQSTASAYMGFSAAARGTALEGAGAKAVFEAVSKASVVMGLSADQSSGALLALQQMISKGTVQAEELRGQLGERLPGAFQTAARAMGVTTQELGKMLEQGQVIADDFLPKFAAQLERDIGGAAEKSADRLGAALVRMDTAWEKLKKNIGDSGVSKFMDGQYAILADAFNGVSEAMERAKGQGSGFTGQMVAATGAALQFINPLQALSYSAIESGAALKQAEAEFAKLRAQHGVKSSNIYVQSEMFQLQQYIAKLKEAQGAQAALTGVDPRHIEANQTRGASLARWDAEQAAATKALSEERMKAAGINKEYFASLKVYQDARKTGVMTEKEYIAAVSELAKKTYDGSTAGKEAAKTARDGASAAKEAASAQKAAASQYESLILSIRERIAIAEEELKLGRKLTDSDRQAIKLNELLDSTKSKLSATQRAALITASEEAIVGEARVKNMVENAAAHERMRKALLADVAVSEKSVATLTDQNKSMREEVELIGLSEAAQHAVTQARAAAIILIKEQELATLQAAEADLGSMSRRQIALAAEIEQLRERNQLTGAKFDKTQVAKAAADAAKEWEKFGDDVERGLTDSLYRSFEAGKGFFTTLWDGIKNLFKTTVLKLAVQGVMTGITGGASGAANAAGGGGGLGGLINTGQNIYSAFTGGIAGIGGMIGNLGAAIGSQFVSQFGLGMVAPALSEAALAAGAMGPAAAGLAGSLGSFAAAAGPWALAAAAVFGLVKKFDTSGTPHVGSLAQYSAADGLSTSQTHGAFGMGFGGVDYSEGAATLVQGVSKTIVGILDSTATAFGKAAGYSVATGFADDSSKDGAWGGLLIKQMENMVVNWDDTRSSKWAPKEFADGEAGQKEYLAALSKSVLGALNEMDLPGWAQGMLDALGDSPALDGLAGVVDQINTTKTALAQMGMALDGFAGMGDDAVTALIKASGGIAALSANASSYFDNYYTEAEKQALATQQMTDALAQVNIELPASRDEYRKLVEQYTAMGAEGAPTLAALLALNGAFAAITPATAGATAAVEELAKSLAQTLDALRNPVRSIDEIAKNIIDLEEQLFQAENAGNTDALREHELKGLTDTEAAMARRLWALADEKTKVEAATAAAEAAAQAAAAIASERAGIEREILSLTANTATTRAAELAGLDATNRALKEHYYALVDEKDAAAEAAAALATMLSGAGISASSMADTIRDGLLGRMSQEDVGAKLADMVVGGINNALVGGFADQISASFISTIITPMLTAVTTGGAISTAVSQSSIDAVVANATAAAASIAAIAKDPAWTAAIAAINDAITGIATAVATPAAAAAAAMADDFHGWYNTGERLLGSSGSDGWAQVSDAAVDAADKAASAWQGLSDSLVEEIKRIRGVMDGVGQQGYAASQSAFAIATAQARAGDQEAMKSLPALSRAMLELAEANTSTESELRLMQAQTAGSLEATNADAVKKYGLTVPSMDVGTNNVPHDMLLMAHAGEAIVPRAYNPALGGGSQADMRGVEARLERVESALISIAMHTEETARIQRSANVLGQPVRNVDGEKLEMTIL